MLQMGKDESARSHLLPFDKIEYAPQQAASAEPSRLVGLAQAFGNQQRSYQIAKTKRAYSLSKLGDPSCGYFKAPDSRITSYLRLLDSKLAAIRPDSAFIIWWNLFMILAMLFNFFEIPIALFMTEKVYEYQTNVSGALAINLIFLIGLIVDSLVVRPNLGYYKQGKLISNRKQIIRRYLKANFWVDLIGWMVLLIYIVGGNSKLIYLKAVFYIKFVTFVQVDQQILDWLSIRPVRYAMYRLSRTIMVMWFFTTWVSSGYFAMDYFYYRQKGFYYQTGQLWLTNSNTVGNIDMIKTFPWYIWLEYAVYWSLQTSSTVGYGNITPRNPHEVLYCDFVIIINTALFAYYMNTIWDVIGELQGPSQKYSRNWADLRSALNSKKIPSELNRTIGDFLEETWLEEDEDIVEEELKQMLSEDLHGQLLLSTREKFFKQIPLFQQIRKASSDKITKAGDFFKKLVMQIEERMIGMGETIYSPGDTGVCLYYVLRGKIQITHEQLNIDFDVCKNENFGQDEFFTAANRFTTATAFVFSKVWSIKRQSFLHALREYPHLYGNFCELKERILLEDCYHLSGGKCYKCLKSHSTVLCPQLSKWRDRLRLKKYWKAHQGKGFINRTHNNRSSKIGSNKIIGVQVQKKPNYEGVANKTSYRIAYNVNTR